MENNVKSKKLVELINNKPYIVNWRRRGELRIDVCFFCGERHEHGRDEGHRVAHCLPEKVNSAYDYHGTEITYKDGYIIRDY